MNNPNPDESPQAQSPKKPAGKKAMGCGGWLLLIILGAATAFTLLWATKAFLPALPQKPSVQKTAIPRVSVYRVVSPPQLRKVVLPGRVVKPDPIMLNTPVSGKILTLLAQKGQVYAKGTLIAELKSPVLEARLIKLQDQVAEAQDNLLDAAQNHSGSYAQAQREYDALQREMNGVKADLQALHVKMPWRGRILRTHVRPGQTLAAGTPMATVETLRNLDVVMSLPVTVLVALKEKESLEVLAKTRWGQMKTRGRVTLIELPANPDETTGTLRIGLSANREVPLRQGQSVQVVFWLPTHGHYWVPVACVKTRGDKPVVGVVAPRGKTTALEVRPVVTGLVSDGMVELVSGVVSGEQLVREGLTSFRPRQVVHAVNGVTDDGPFSPGQLGQ